MDVAKAGGIGRPGPRHAFGGLEAGVLGALVMVTYIALVSIWRQRSIWLVPNLFGTTFFGNDGYQNAFGPGSLAGTSLFVAIYGALGLVWGLLAGDRLWRGMTLFGAVAGFTVYYALFHFIWKHINPLVMLYSPDQELAVGHVMWGMIVAQSPKFSRRIARMTTHPAHEESLDVPAFHG